MKHLFAFTLTTFILFGTAAAQNPTSVQAAYEARTPSWWTNLPTNLSDDLHAADQGTQAVALQNVTYFATHHGERVDLRLAVPKLLDIARFASEPAHRTMALIALNEIGTPYALEQVAELMRFERHPIAQVVGRGIAAQ